eukprot:TRINITY_DN3529_c0_g1_i4.p1 TRINITY_DN3529_c0_g1~~TRINITY_DN3529_c0_g1_i4.p1  ORF type:complete len:437 (+),score=146.43 TRINITY_DN3529_c0_g1_i4:35-1345(+)
MAGVALTGKLRGKTLFITGASRGIGQSIALKAARDGANIIIAAKTAEPHPKLPGTIYTAAKEIEAAGGKCLPCIADIRDENQIQKAVEEGVKKFGGIDICINNASAISLTPTLKTDPKKFDLMMGVNTRGTFLTSRACIPHLKKSSNPHILNISPPLNLSPRWFKDHTAYTIAKYGMSLCVLGMAEEFRVDGIAVNALWPKTAIYTAAMEMLGGKEVEKNCRKPEIMADAAYHIITQTDRSFTGKFLIDEMVVKEAGVKDLAFYAFAPAGAELIPDFFLDENVPTSFSFSASSGSSSASSSSSGSSSSSSSSSSPPPPPASTVGADPQLTQLFSKIKSSITPQMVAEVRGVVQVELSDAQDPYWFIDLKREGGDAGRGRKEGGEVNVTFKCSSKDFEKLVRGEMSPTKAYFTGKVKIDGSMSKASKIIKYLPEIGK